MVKFLGFKQVTLSQYNSVSQEDRKGYMWLVRELSGDTELSSALYFGNRKYAEVNSEEAAEKLNDVITSFGDAVDENGEFVGFLPIEEHSILSDSGITSFTDAMEALEAAILANSDEIAGKVSQSEYDAKVSELEDAISEAGKVNDVKVDGVSVVDEDKIANIDLSGKADKADVDDLAAQMLGATGDISEIKETLEGKADKTDVEGLQDELAQKANAEDVYTKQEIDEKIAKTFKFKGDAESISDDETTITVNGEEIEANDDNIGFVYQIGDAEYASNGEKWIKLGFNIDLSEYATKDELTEVGNSKVEKTIVGTNGTAEIFNEADGGGAHFTQNDGSESFVGVNDGSNDGLMAQIYADKLTDEGTWSGSRINVYNDKITYQSKESTDAGIAKNADELEIVVKKDLNEVEERVEALENVSTVTALTYTDALELDLANGQIVYVSNSEEGESGHTSGAYIKVGDNLKKLDTSTGDGQTLADRVDSLENTVGNTELPDGKTLTSAVSELLDDKTHEIDGNDVEE